MAKTTGDDAASIRRSAQSEAVQFDLMQFVRILEGEARRGGGQAPDVQGSTDLAYPDSEVTGFDAETGTVTTPAFGLFGRQGPMPWSYSDILHEQGSQGNEAITAFLSIFERRLNKALYEAWLRGKFGLRFERGEPEGLLEHLLCLAGAGTEGLAERLETPGTEFSKAAIGFYGGLLSRQPRSPRTIQVILEDLLGVPVEIESCTGLWLDTPREVRAVLGTSKLGETSVVGSASYSRMAAIAVGLGPVPRRLFDRLCAAEDARGQSRLHHALSAFLVFCLPSETAVRLDTLLKSQDVPRAILGHPAEQRTGSRLGLNAWLAPDLESDGVVSDCRIWLGKASQPTL